MVKLYFVSDTNINNNRFQNVTISKIIFRKLCFLNSCQGITVKYIL